MMATVKELDQSRIRTAEIELAVAFYFARAQALSVPNVSWGMGLHECDVLVLTKSGYLYEVEIKVSMSDLIRDGHKDHGHVPGKRSPGIIELYYAMPVALFDKISDQGQIRPDLIPNRAGVFSFRRTDSGAPLKLERKAEPQTRPFKISVPAGECWRTSEIPPARKLTIEERYQFARLGTLRIWSLKKKIEDLRVGGRADAMIAEIENQGRTR